MLHHFDRIEREDSIQTRKANGYLIKRNYVYFHLIFVCICVRYTKIQLKLKSFYCNLGVLNGGEHRSRAQNNIVNFNSVYKKDTAMLTFFHLVKRKSVLPNSVF